MPSDCQGTATLGTNYCVKQPKFQNVGKDPESVLGLCSGDCDTDDDCESGLKCAENNFDFEAHIICEVCEVAKASLAIQGIASECKRLPSPIGILDCTMSQWNYFTLSNALNSCSGKVSVDINTTI